MTKAKIDRRVVRTRAALHAALLALIEDKGYEAITIEEICARANIGRSTFYAHYKSKEDLMRGGLRNIRKLFADGPGAHPAAAGVNGARLAFVLPLLIHARDHRHLHRALVGSRGAAIARDMVQQILRDHLRGALASGGPARKDAISRELVVQYLVGAYLAVTNWWLDGDMAMPAEEIAAAFERLAIDGVPALRQPRLAITKTMAGKKRAAPPSR